MFESINTFLRQTCFLAVVQIARTIYSDKILRLSVLGLGARKEKYLEYLTISLGLRLKKFLSKIFNTKTDPSTKSSA